MYKQTPAAALLALGRVSGTLAMSGEQLSSTTRRALLRQACAPAVAFTKLLETNQRAALIAGRLSEAFEMATAAMCPDFGDNPPRGYVSECLWSGWRIEVSRILPETAVRPIAIATEMRCDTRRVHQALIDGVMARVAKARYSEIAMFIGPDAPKRRTSISWLADNEARVIGYTEASLADPAVEEVIASLAGTWVQDPHQLVNIARTLKAA